MKVREVSKSGGFKPLSITIDFENVDEIKDMWMRINPSTRQVIDWYESGTLCNTGFVYPSQDNCHGKSNIWSILNSYIDNNNVE
jgi:hypothetical protein